jgi:pantoate--beta-alanine ligase
MDVVSTIEALRAASAKLGGTAFVPTMGNLHEGHLSLIQQAKANGRPVVVSIFVNPLQFAPSEDFASYPRTLADDLAGLADEGVDLVFTPDERELYPEPQIWKVMPPTDIGDVLEGASRPGFFTGVATVVLKLLNLVRTQIAVFGKKDYQQLLIVRAMCRQFALPIEILACETVRDADGLALSSRNRYLLPAERAEAPALRRCLLGLAKEVRRPSANVAVLERRSADELMARGWKVDYMTVRNQADLTPIAAGDDPSKVPLVILGAAHLGKMRLIDNLELG